MFEYMEELSVTETENLRKTISNLFRQTCILQVKYDPVTLTPRDNLKMIYRDKILGEGLEATVTTLEEIREYGKNTNLLNWKLKVTEWQEALYLLSKHQMIEVPGAVRDVEDQTPIYIYSTVNLYLSSSNINELLEEYREEIAEDEAIEENLYENAAE